MFDQLPLVRMTFVALVLALAGCAATSGHVTQKEPVPEINMQQGVALKGYDPVAYFSNHAPTKGTDQLTYSWRGLTWKFASAENRDAFAHTPEHYAPEFGGYCAFAISRGQIADIDPNSWAVVGDKLYLNNNPFAQEFWDQDRPGNIEAGNVNWPLVPKIPPAQIGTK
jgi:hypothetical protein